MKYFEFGRENEELMVFLHGGGTSYPGVLPTAQKIAEKYHVVLLAYDGFNPSEPETEFRSGAWVIPGTEDLRPYITAKDKKQKWIMGTLGMALLAAILSGIMVLILQ